MKNNKIILLTFGLIISSLHFERLLSGFAILLYPLAVFFALKLLINFQSILISSLQKVGTTKFFIGLMCLLVIAFIFYYPYENERGHGTDRDEGLNQTVIALSSFQYPYYERTYVQGKAHEEGYDNRPMTMLPGSMLFASPFVLLGNSAYQNFFWITILFFSLLRNFKSSEFAFIALIIIIFFCATFLFQLLIGSDYISNVIWIFILISLYIERMEQKEQNVHFILFLLGLGLSSRFHFLFLLFPLAFFIVSKTGIKTMIQHIGIVLFAFTIITLPFALYDYANFTPIHYSNLYVQFNTLIDNISIIVPVATLIFSLWISGMVYKGRMDVWLAMSLICFVAIFPIVIFDSIKTERLNLQNTHYLLPFSFFFSLYVLKDLHKDLSFSKNNNPV